MKVLAGLWHHMGGSRKFHWVGVRGGGGGGGGADIVLFFSSSTYFTEGHIDLPRKPIASRGWSVAEFNMETYRHL